MESLYELDRFFEEHSKDGEPLKGGLLAEQRGMRLFALGAYVGEVLIRYTNGDWYADFDDPAAEINISIRSESGCEAWPVKRILKRYKNGIEDSIGDYGDGFLNIATDSKVKKPKPPPLPPTFKD